MTGGERRGATFPPLIAVKAEGSKAGLAYVGAGLDREGEAWL
jgi:hypothetical protein